MGHSGTSVGLDRKQQKKGFPQKEGERKNNRKVRAGGHEDGGKEQCTLGEQKKDAEPHCVV